MADFTNTRRMTWFVLWAILAITFTAIAKNIEGAGSVAAAAVASLAGLASIFNGVSNWRETKESGK